ncbi:hypothetical protein PCE1_000385 [Barthelona sp. PCE]
MRYGVILIGPPGSGKSTLCTGLYDFLKSFERNPFVMNLDLLNDTMMYKPAIDIRETISTTTLFDEYGLGPNGAILSSFDLFSHKLDWVQTEIERLDPQDDDEDSIWIVDAPGQVELFLDHEGFRTVCQFFEQLEFTLCVLTLNDVLLLTDASRLISSLLHTVSFTINLQLPTVNILTKIDLLDHLETKFDIETVLNAYEYDFLLPHLNNSRPHLENLNEVLIELLEEFKVLDLVPCNVQDKYSMFDLMLSINNVTGFVMHTEKAKGLIDRLTSEVAARENSK